MIHMQIFSIQSKHDTNLGLKLAQQLKFGVFLSRRRKTRVRCKYRSGEYRANTGIQGRYWLRSIGHKQFFDLVIDVPLPMKGFLLSFGFAYLESFLKHF